MKHTPSPWILAKYGAIRGGETRELIGGPVQEQIAMACVIGDSQEANARLIAAAPDMLKALQAISDVSLDHDSAFAIMQAVRKMKRIANEAVEDAVGE